MAPWIGYREIQCITGNHRMGVCEWLNGHRTEATGLTGPVQVQVLVVDAARTRPLPSIIRYYTAMLFPTFIPPTFLPVPLSTCQFFPFLGIHSSFSRSRLSSPAWINISCFFPQEFTFHPENPIRSFRSFHRGPPLHTLFSPSPFLGRRLLKLSPVEIKRQKPNNNIYPR